MFNRFLSQLPLALLVALPLMAEPVSQEENAYFKEANLSALPFRSKCHRFHLVQPKPHHRKRCCRKGPTGPTGPTGSTGPAGIGPSLDYASFITTTTMINANSPVPFDVISVNDNDPSAQNGTTITPGVSVNSPTNTIFTIQVPGDYSIDFGYCDQSASAPLIFQILKNGSPINGGGGTIANIIFVGTSLQLAGLQAGDTISIQAVDAISFARSGVQVGYLKFTRVGP